MEVESRIKGMLAELSVVTPDQIRREDRLREDLGLDSVSSMELLSMLSEELDLDIEMEDAIRVSTVAEILNLVQARLDERC